MKEKEEVQEVQVQEETMENAEVMEVKSNAEIVNDLLKAGCKKFVNVVVKNVTATEKDDYTMVTFTTRNQFPTMRVDEFGEAKETIGNIIYSSSYALAGIAKEKEGHAWLGNYLANKPQIAQLLFSEAKLTVVQQRVEAGKEYHNPFSTSEKSVVFQNDTILYHIIDFELSKTGKNFMNQLLAAITAKAIDM